MASKIRSGISSILVSALFGLLIASFAIWGVGGGMFMASDRVVATVGDTEIETADLKRAVDNQARQYQQQFGGAISTQEIIERLQLHVQTLRQMITSGALIDTSKTLGLQGTDEQLAQEMLKIDVFQPIKKGVIDRETVMQTLQNVGLTYTKYVSDTKNSIAQDQLINSITASTPVPRSLAEQLFTYRTETRSARLLALPGSIVKNIADPQEGELESYYETRKSAYMAPEYRSYNYILLTPDSFETQVELNEEDILKEYEYKKSEYITPATRTLQQVSLESEEAALIFSQRVKAGEDFAKVAVDLSDFTEEEITLPVSSYQQIEDDFSKEVADVVFALEIDEMTSPLEGAIGWSFFKAVEITEGTERSFEDVRTELEAAYIKDQAINLLYEYTERVEEVLSEGGDLSQISEQLNIPMATLTNVDARGRGNENEAKILTEAGGIILNAAYEGELGDFLELKDMNANADDRRMYLLELTDVVEPSQKSFESVQDEIKVSWIADARQREIGQISETILERMRNGEDPDELAVEFDGTSYAANNIRRTGTAESNISQNLRRLIFTMKIGETDMEVAADSDGYIIATLDIIKPGLLEGNKGQVDVILAQLEANMANELMSQYQVNIGRELETTINETVFRRTFNVQE